MFTPVDFISVSKHTDKQKATETAGSIAAKPAPIFTAAPETAGSIASSSTTSSSGSSSFCAMA